jgi:hypothetical protein
MRALTTTPKAAAASTPAANATGNPGFGFSVARIAEK